MMTLPPVRRSSVKSIALDITPRRFRLSRWVLATCIWTLNPAPKNLDRVSAPTTLSDTWFDELYDLAMTGFWECGHKMCVETSWDKRKPCAGRIIVLPPFLPLCFGRFFVPFFLPLLSSRFLFAPLFSQGRRKQHFLKARKGSIARSIHWRNGCAILAWN